MECTNTKSGSSEGGVHDGSPPVLPSISELAGIKVAPVQTKRLANAPSGLILEPFNAEHVTKITDKELIEPKDPVTANKWKHK